MFCAWNSPRILIKPRRSSWLHPVIPLKFPLISLFFLPFLQAPNHSLPHILPVPTSQYSPLFLICSVLIMYIQKYWELRSVTLILPYFFPVAKKFYLGSLGKGRKNGWVWWYQRSTIWDRKNNFLFQRRVGCLLLTSLEEPFPIMLCAFLLEQSGFPFPHPL